MSHTKSKLKETKSNVTIKLNIKKLKKIKVIEIFLEFRLFFGTLWYIFVKIPQTFA